MHTQPPTATPRYRSLLKALAVVLLLSALAIAAGLLFRAQTAEALDKTEQQLTILGKLKVDQLMDWRRERLGDAGVMTDSPYLVAALARWLADPNPKATAQALTRFRSLQTRYGYQDVLLLDPDGRIRLSLSGLGGTIEDDSRADLALALKTGQPLMQDLHQDDRHAYPHLGILAPLRQDGMPVGGVMLIVDARHSLYPLLAAAPIASPSLEKFLVRRDGDSMLLVSPLRYLQGAELARREPLTQRQLPGVGAALGETGLVQAIDYRNRPVLALIQQVPDSAWALVTKIDLDEAYAAAWQHTALILSLVSGIGLLLAGGGALYWQARQKAQYQALYQAEASRRASEQALLAEAETRRQREAEVERLGRFYAALSQVNSALLRCGTREDALAAICQVMVETGHMDMAWAGWVDPGNQRIVPAVSCGDRTGYLDSIEVYATADRPEGLGPSGTALRENRTCICEDFAAPHLQPWQAAAAKAGWACAASLPLRLSGQPCGVISLYSQRPGAFGGREIELLELATANVSYTLDALDREQRRQAAERELGIAADRYTRMLQATSDGFWLVDALDGRILDVNEAAVKMTGFTREAMLAMRITDIDVLHDQAAFEASIRRIMAQGWAVFETRHRTADGQVIDVEVSTLPDGQSLTMIAFLRDISERKRQEHQLRKLSMAVEQSPASILITDTRGTIEYVNHTFSRVSGYPAAEAVGRNPRFLASGQTTRGTYRAMWEALTHGRTWRGELVNRRKDGAILIEDVQIVPIRQADGEISHYLALKEDITSRKGLEELLALHRDHLEDLVEERTVQLEEARRQAEAANQAKSQFVANMSHEIRTPMNAILGFSSLLEKRPLEPAQRELVKKIRASGENLLGIINDILDFSKIEAGRLSIEQIPFRLSALFDELAALMSNLAGSKPVEFVIRAVPEGADWVKGDPLRVKQVLVNLASNAIKFTERGEVVLEATILQAEAGAARLRFAVRDTGIGIAKDQQKLIFSAFSQADGSTTRRFGGTGLGLSICQRLVALMGGEIGVSSTPGQGSEFWFVLPFESCPAEPAEAPILPQHLRVLIVDDNRAARDALYDMAQALGWDAETAESGLAGIECVARRLRAEQPFDLVLMDWRMPGMDGLSASQTLRDICPASSQPIIIMVTAYDREQLTGQAGAEAVDLLLSKPVTASALHQAASGLLMQHIGAAEPDSAPAEQPLAGLKVLVVDDNEVNRDVAQLNLEDLGAAVTLARNGQEALDWLAAHPATADLVLMDVQMPVMDGYAATRHIRQRPELAGLPIVALSAGAFQEQREAALKAGMDDFVAKPFDMAQVVAVVRRLCGRENGEDGAADTASSFVPDGAAPRVALDAQQGLRLWKNQAAYAKQLRRFAEAYAVADELIAEALAQEDIPAALGLAHKLKGVAGSLALPEVARCAGQVEQAVADENSGDSAATATIAALGTAIADALDAIAELGSPEPAPAPLPGAARDLGAIAPLLAQLLRDLDQDAPNQAEATLDALAGHVPAALLKPVRDALDGFDFRGAETETQALAQRLGIA